MISTNQGSFEKRIVLKEYCACGCGPFVVVAAAAVVDCGCVVSKYMFF